MKEFKHACQPHGTIVLKNATREEVEVPNRVPNVGIKGTKKIMRVTGEVVSSMMRSLFGGVAVTEGREKYPIGSIQYVDYVTDYEWEQGVKISVAM